MKYIYLDELIPEKWYNSNFGDAIWKFECLEGNKIRYSKGYTDKQIKSGTINNTDYFNKITLATYEEVKKRFPDVDINEFDSINIINSPISNYQIY